MRSNFFDSMMFILGGPKPKIGFDDKIKWGLYITYAFLMNIVNMKLLISMIGETFAKYQLSRVPMSYNMKVTYLLEFSKLRNKLKIWNLNTKIDKNAKYFHWFVYKDSMGLANNQWPGLLKIVVKNVKQNRDEQLALKNEVQSELRSIDQRMQQMNQSIQFLAKQF